MTLMAPVCAALAAQSKAACTSFSEKPNRCVIIMETSTLLLSMSFKQSGYYTATEGSCEAICLLRASRKDRCKQSRNAC